jgi:hypothetical protein
MRTLLKAVLWTVGLAAGAVVLAVLVLIGSWTYVILKGPDRTPSPAQDKERTFGLTAQQAATTEETWLRHDGDFTDASGSHFVKTGEWHQTNVSGLTFMPDGRQATYYTVVEGRYVPGGDAALPQTYSGDAQFRFERQADNRWEMAKVILQGIPLELNVAIQIVERPEDSGYVASSQSAVPAGPLTRDDVDAALAEWLAREDMLGANMMKEAGGTARITVDPPRRSGTAVAFSKVPYHCMGCSTARQFYSGPGSVEFVVCDDGQWALGWVELSGLRSVPPAVWGTGDCGKRGIRVGSPPGGRR